MFLLSPHGPILGSPPAPGGEEPPKRTSVDLSRVADQLGSVRLTRDEAWVEAFCSKFPASTCAGFYGSWRFYTTEMELSEELKCIRTYQYDGEREPGEVRLRNFYVDPPTTRKATQRDQDGLYETVFTQSFAEPYYSCSTRPFPSEAKEGLPRCLFWRAIPVDRDILLRLAPKLPPKPRTGITAMYTRYPGWSPQGIATAKWAIEAFFEDGENRWSMGPLYSVQSLRLESHFCISEFRTVVDPDAAIDMTSQPSKEDRPKLPEDPQAWLGEGWRGRMREIVWDEDGDMLQLRARPCRWSPPDMKQQSSALFLYPDMMYGFYPRRMQQSGKDARAAFASTSIRFEMGGLMRDKDEFRRLIVRYNSATGECESITMEVYADGQRASTESV